MSLTATVGDSSHAVSTYMWVFLAGIFLMLSGLAEIAIMRRSDVASDSRSETPTGLSHSLRTKA